MDNVHGQIFQMLTKWKNRQSRKVNQVEVLKSALAQSGRWDLAVGTSGRFDLLTRLCLYRVYISFDTFMK